MAENSIKIESPIDTTIIRIINELREEPIWWREMNDNPIDSLIIAVRFDENDKNKGFYGADSVVYILFLDDTDYSKYGFKGIINMNDYKIAIFDKSDIGGYFYNGSALEQVDMKDLYKPHINLAVIFICRVKGDRLVLWIAP
jgi:hypothetical protein